MPAGMGSRTAARDRALVRWGRVLVAALVVMTAVNVALGNVAHSGVLAVAALLAHRCLRVNTRRYLSSRLSGSHPGTRRPG